jgi:hypothetical protein
MKMKLLMIILFLIVLPTVVAQNTSPFDEKNKPPDNSLFGEPKKNNDEINSNNEDMPKHILRLMVSEFVRSEFRFMYDYKLNNSFRVTAGIGLPLGKDLIDQELNSGEFFKTSTGEFFDYLWITDLYKVSTHNSGITLSSSMKLCPSNNSRNYDYFMELGYKFARHNFDISQSMISHSINDVSLKTNCHYLTLLYGNTWSSGSDKIKWVNEFGLGIGIKIENWNAIEIVQDENTGNETYRNTSDRKSITSPVLVIRYSFGIGWL